MQIDLRESWQIRDVEIPTRLVLAPMAGVSVQAFRRQGRRFGAGLVCSEMVSCAGIEHRNEKTLGYLRVASDEHPLAIQIFGSEPRTMADAARMVEAAGADLVDAHALVADLDTHSHRRPVGRPAVDESVAHDVGDGAPPGGQDRAHQQDREPLVRRVGEGEDDRLGQRVAAVAMAELWAAR